MPRLRSLHILLALLSLSPLASAQSLQDQWHDPVNRCSKAIATWRGESRYYCISQNGIVVNEEGDYEGEIGSIKKSRFRGMVVAWAFENGSLVRYICSNIPNTTRCHDRVDRDVMARNR